MIKKMPNLSRRQFMQSASTTVLAMQGKLPLGASPITEIAAKLTAFVQQNSETTLMWFFKLTERSGSSPEQIANILAKRL